MKRRDLLVSVGASLALRGGAVRAQPRRHRVAFLSGGSPTDNPELLASLRDALRAHGYRDPDNLELVTRYASYSQERAAALAKDIAAQRPAVIVANGSGIAAAFALSPPIPVVFLYSGDPVEAGYALSLARPGRHATGITLLALDLIVKRVEYLQAIRPGMKRIAFLASPEHPGQRRELAASRAAATQLALQIDYHEARNPPELEAALARVAAERPEAALLFSDALMAGQRASLAEFFLEHRIPTSAGWSGFPEAGHLMSYGAERRSAWARLAYYVDRILRGTPPAELPVELPSAVELVVNRRTADKMGLVLPPSIMSRADRVVPAS
jgi:putative tryptophan/tyrosine transport system substrate-binding protein